MVHLSVSVLLNTWTLKVILFGPYYMHTIECGQHMSGMPNINPSATGDKSVKLQILPYQGQYLNISDKLFWDMIYTCGDTL